MFFIYRYLVRESCSQFDSLPLTYLTILRSCIVALVRLVIELPSAVLCQDIVPPLQGALAAAVEVLAVNPGTSAYEKRRRADAEAACDLQLQLLGGMVPMLPSSTLVDQLLRGSISLPKLLLRLGVPAPSSSAKPVPPRADSAAGPFFISFVCSYILLFAHYILLLFARLDPADADGARGSGATAADSAADSAAGPFFISFVCSYILLFAHYILLLFARLDPADSAWESRLALVAMLGSVCQVRVRARACAIALRVRLDAARTLACVRTHTSRSHMPTPTLSMPRMPASHAAASPARLLTCPVRCLSLSGRKSRTDLCSALSAASLISSRTAPTRSARRSSTPPKRAATQ